MGGDGFERLAPVKVITKFLRVGFGVFAIHHLGNDHALLREKFTQGGAGLGVVTDALGDDVAGTAQGVAGIFNPQLFVFVISVHKLGSFIIQFHAAGE